MVDHRRYSSWLVSRFNDWIKHIHSPIWWNQFTNLNHDRENFPVNKGSTYKIVSGWISRWVSPYNSPFNSPNNESHQLCDLAAPSGPMPSALQLVVGNDELLITGIKLQPAIVDHRRTIVGNQKVRVSAIVTQDLSPAIVDCYSQRWFHLKL